MARIHKIIRLCNKTQNIAWTWSSVIIWENSCFTVTGKKTDTQLTQQVPPATSQWVLWPSCWNIQPECSGNKESASSHKSDLCWYTSKIAPPSEVYGTACDTLYQWNSKDPDKKRLKEHRRQTASVVYEQQVKVINQESVNGQRNIKRTHFLWIKV